MSDPRVHDFAGLLDGMTPEQRLQALRDLEEETKFCWACGYDGCSGVCQNDE